jgi:calcineurin-like phosphoesterase family protein
MKYFTSDLHFSHEGVIKWSNRPFKNVDEMNEVMLSNLLETVKHGDDLYFIGDLSWDNEYTKFFFDKIKHINFHWILGNHEKGSDTFRQRCKSMSPLKEIKLSTGESVTLCHYPMVTWNKSHYGSFMLYGHHHANSHGTDQLATRAPGKMLNVNVEFHDYKPWSEKEIIDYMATRPNNWDLIDKTTDRMH